jgi:hypothetical protein
MSSEDDSIYAFGGGERERERDKAYWDDLQ